MKVVSPRVTSVKDYLLFIHTMSGCDTTSAPYEEGKISFMNLVNKSEMLKDISDTMNDVWADQAEIGIASISNVYNDVWRKKRRHFEENTVHKGKLKKPIRST